MSFIAAIRTVIETIAHVSIRHTRTIVALEIVETASYTYGVEIKGFTQSAVSTMSVAVNSNQ